jgi:hypothetical protein
MLCHVDIAHQHCKQLRSRSDHGTLEVPSYACYIKYSINTSSKSRDEGKVVHVHTMNAYRRSRGIAPLILNFDTRWRWSTSRPDRFTPRMELQYPLNRRLGGPHGRSGRFWRRENLLSLPEFEVQPVASRYTDWVIPAPHQGVTRAWRRRNFYAMPTLHNLFLSLYISLAHSYYHSQYYTTSLSPTLILIIMPLSLFLSLSHCHSLSLSHTPSPSLHSEFFL